MNLYSKNLRHSIQVFLFACLVMPTMALAQSSNASLNSKKSTTLQAKPKSSLPAKNGSPPKISLSAKPSPIDPETTKDRSIPWALMLQGGWAATYGNGISTHWYPVSWLDINAGLGFNLSGFKAGFGANFDHSLGDYGLTAGLTLLGSTGHSGKVSLDAKFTPDNSSDSQVVRVTKSYTVSKAMILSLSTGGYYKYSNAIHFVGQVIYGIKLSGNQVSLDEKISYSKLIDVNNEEYFTQEFNKKARETSQAGGAGFLLGIRFVFN